MRAVFRGSSEYRSPGSISMTAHVARSSPIRSVLGHDTRERRVNTAQTMNMPQVGPTRRFSDRPCSGLSVATGCQTFCCTSCTLVGHLWSPAIRRAHYVLGVFGESASKPQVVSVPSTSRGATRRSPISCDRFACVWSKVDPLRADAHALASCGRGHSVHSLGTLANPMPLFRASP